MITTGGWGRGGISASGWGFAGDYQPNVIIGSGILDVETVVSVIDPIRLRNALVDLTAQTTLSADPQKISYAVWTLDIETAIFANPLLVLDVHPDQLLTRLMVPDADGTLRPVDAVVAPYPLAADLVAPEADAQARLRDAIGAPTVLVSSTVLPGLEPGVSVIPVIVAPTLAASVLQPKITATARQAAAIEPPTLRVSVSVPRVDGTADEDDAVSAPTTTSTKKTRPLGKPE